MAEVQSVQKGNKYEVKKKKEKTKREKAPKLSTRKRLLQSREVAQGKKNYEAFYSFILAVLGFFVILFILFGGINQRKFIMATKNLGETISGIVGRLINPSAFDITDDGVYINPEKLSENISDSTDNFNNGQEQQVDENTEEGKEEENK